MGVEVKMQRGENGSREGTTEKDDNHDSQYSLPNEVQSIFKAN